MGDAFDEFWSAVPDQRVPSPPPLTFSARVHAFAAIAIAVVLVAGVLAVIGHDDHVASAAGVEATPLPRSTVTVRPTTTTTTTLPPLFAPSSSPVSPNTVVIGTATSPANGSTTDPESASRRLWDAYTQGDQTAAARVASPAVVDTMFSVPYDGGRGVFQGCEPKDDRLFDCQEVEDTGRTFDLTAQLDGAGNAHIQVITITSPPATTTTTAPPPSTSSPSTTTTTFPLHG